MNDNVKTIGSSIGFPMPPEEYKRVVESVKVQKDGITFSLELEEAGLEYEYWIVAVRDSDGKRVDINPSKLRFFTAQDYDKNKPFDERVQVSKERLTEELDSHIGRYVFHE